MMDECMMNQPTHMRLHVILDRKTWEMLGELSARVSVTRSDVVRLLIGEAHRKDWGK